MVFGKSYTKILNNKPNQTRILVGLVTYGELPQFSLHQTICLLLQFHVIIIKLIKEKADGYDQQLKQKADSLMQKKLNE